MIGIRNRLVHTYFDIDLDIIWTTCTEELPEIVKQVTAVLDE
jgi:uncharacterized protein with HEPN domain